MRVFKLKFRTPGIFLDEQGNNFKGDLIFEVKKEGDTEWKSVEDYGIKVILEKNFKVNTITNIPEFVSTISKVPKRDEGELNYEIVIPDNDKYDYRIIATKCPDCYTLFRETHQVDRIIDTANPNGKIVVGQGTINKVQV